MNYESKKKSILALLIGLSFFYMSCSSDSDDIEVLQNTKSVDNTEVNQSKIIFDEMTLIASFNFPSTDNNDTIQPKIILNNENFSISVSYNFETGLEATAEQP